MKTRVWEQFKKSDNTAHTVILYFFSSYITIIIKYLNKIGGGRT